MHLHDLAFLGPGLLFLDQYFNSFIDEYLVLWIALVSTLNVGINSFNEKKKCWKFAVCGKVTVREVRLMRHMGIGSLPNRVRGNVDQLVEKG